MSNKVTVNESSNKILVNVNQDGEVFVDVLQGSLTVNGSMSPGDVVGPVSGATDNAIARYDGASGKLIQNSGITIADGASGTLSGTNTGDQNVFSTFAVSGGGSVAAETATDTLTLIPGSNITITADAGTDSITINSTASGSGDVVGPVSATDNAVARYDTTSGKLIQNSTVTISDAGAIANVDSITFDTATPPALTTQGQMAWNADEETVDIQLNGFALHTGEHIVYHVKNETGSTIAKGVPVMFAGTNGNSGKLLIQPWNGTGPSEYFMGLTAEELSDDEEGFVVSFGKLRGIQTNGGNYGQTWVNGDIIYAATTTGNLTKTQPAAPNPHITVCAVVSAHASNGTLFIRPTLGSNIKDDEGVTITSLTSGQLLVANSAGTVFENKSVSGDATLANTGALTLANTTVVSGSYTNTNLTVDNKGRITAASNGSVASHASTHVTGGTDKIRNATASQDGLMTTAYASKLDAITGTNTGDQNIFSTVTVSGGNSVTADTTSDTLTLVAGSNVTITADTATDTITIAAAGSGGITDGNKGDITVSGGGTTWDVNASAITLAKMANLAQDQFIGRTTASTGVPQTATITAAARTVLDDTSISAMRTTLGVGTTSGPTFGGVTTSAITLLDAFNPGSFGQFSLQDGTSDYQIAPIGTAGNYLFQLPALSGYFHISDQSNGKVNLPIGVTGTLPVTNGGTGITALGTGVATALGQNVTGSGSIVLGTSPTLTTPALGTPSAVVLTNATGTAASLTAGEATAALGLKTSTTTVSVSGATAPTSGQVLTATSSTAATWQTPSGGGGLTNITETLHTASPNNTVNAEQLEVTNGTTNVDLVLTPKGTGAFILGNEPDSTITGGNKRGVGAVDLQMSRDVASRAATGERSFAVGTGNTASGRWSVAMGLQNSSGGDFSTSSGIQNSASGAYSVALGYQVTASGSNAVILGRNGSSSAQGSVAIGESINATATYAVAIGESATASVEGALAMGMSSLANRYGMHAYASGRFAAQGDAQAVRFVARNKTTTNSAVTLFLNGSSARLTIPSGKILQTQVTILGSKSDGTAVASYMRQVTIKNVAGTTSLVGTVNTIGTDEAAGTSIAITADDTNDALQIAVTGITSETWRWVAVVEGVEIAFGN